MRLFVVECRRLRLRRFARYLLLVVGLLLAGAAVAVAVTSERIGPEQVVAAREKADAEYRQRVDEVERARERCLSGSGGGSATSTEGRDCNEIQPPSRGDIEYEWYLPPAFDFKKQFENMIALFTAVLAAAALLVGASFIGAEWSTGGMVNLLLWRPRRLQVFFVKLGALLFEVGVVCAALGLVWAGVFWTIARNTGSASGMTAGVWYSMALTGARGLGLILLAATVGFAIASIGRRTALALGTVVAVAAVGQLGLKLVLDGLGVRLADAYLLTTYGYAWIMKRFEIQNWRSCESSKAGLCEPEAVVVTWQDAGLLFSTTAVALVLLAALITRRRDVGSSV